MEKGKDYDQNFSPTPGIAIACITSTSIAAANDLEVHSIDIEHEVLRPLYGNPSSPRALHNSMDAFFKSEGFHTIGFEESVWERVVGGKYAEDIYVSAHVDHCLIACKSKDIMTAFKKKLECSHGS
jgi:hypothetical protein